MAARGVRLFHRKEPILRHLIFDLRYLYGYSYLDKPGRVINRLMREDPDWIVNTDVNPQGAPLYNARDRCQFAFSTLKMDISLDKTTSGEPILDDEQDEFVDHCDRLSRLVIAELGLTTFTGVGLRALYYFTCQDRDDSENGSRS